MTQHRQRYPGYLAYRRGDDTTLHGYKEDGRQLFDDLRDRGVPPAWIASLRFDPPQLIVSRKLPAALRGKLAIETRMLARLRWLIENHGDDCHDNPTYREIRLAVESNERGSRIAELLPAASTGLKVRQQLLEAHERAHGTKEEKLDRWRWIKRVVSKACKDFEARREHPTKEKLYARAAELARCSPRTVRRVMEKYLSE